MTGLIILEKPTDVLCAKVLSDVKRLLPRGTRIGHAGTLDRFAGGVLIVLIGKATRASERIMSLPKTYEATIKLGATTKTDDRDSPEQPRPAQPVARADIEAALSRFVGTIQQRPPTYSAVKLGGKRASDRARDGHLVQLAPRTVQVHQIDLLDYTWPLLKLRIDCGRGTYIRSIARDLGEALGVGGYVQALRRTRVGTFDETSAIQLKALTSQNLIEHLKNPF